MSAVTEAEYRANVQEMFKALDMDRNDFLDWGECRSMVAAVMKSDGGYNADSFKAKYDTMDKNADGKISKRELIDAVVEVGRERKLFKSASQPAVKRDANPQRTTVKFAIDDANEQAVDVELFRNGLSCLGKTFNNARHAYLKLNLNDKSLVSLKVSHLMLPSLSPSAETITSKSYRF